ncbi:MAG TPA: DUF1573 domain-containing protein [Bacteroidales bacterium]|jgi:hypothetical protein|nr:DUF1573 domain-containing protein [Bacteroidales bacterium]
MKKLFIAALLSMVCISAIPQMAVTTMKLTENEHNFGTFKEEAGRQTYDFYITNTGSQPLVIQNVVASCGCTTPEWTRQPIPAGGKGKVTAIYDPKDRPGTFDKSLSVYTNTKPEVTVLKIKGEVIPREKTVEELYTFAVGGVRFESVQLAFTNIKKTEKKIRVMPVINTSNEPVKIEFENVPAHLTLKVTPETLKPGQKGLVEGTFDASKNPGWGNVSDIIRVKLNGVPQNNSYYYISANLVEDFSKLSKEELANAPVFKTESLVVDLGKIKGQTQNNVEFKFTNAGKSDLYIRHVRASCGCTAIVDGQQGEAIKPGQSGTIKATFNSGGYSGKVSKAVYVYVNDPLRSEVMLQLSADVEQPAAVK